MSFADRLIARTRALGHPLCAGIDPHLPLIPPLFRQGDMAPADPRTAAAVADLLAAALPRLAPHVAVVKPQSAFFEILGWRGIRLLEEIVGQARAAGLPVILDAKRGDIGSTASAYAGYLDGSAPLQADAMTVNPYLGRDTLAPFIDAAKAQQRGVFVLAKTSNPGAADFQDRVMDGAPLYQHVASALAEPCAALRGASGWSSLGLVVGATHPAEHERLRAALPAALFLVPGYGAQGGTARDAVRGFVRRDGRLEGGVVSSSRGLLFPSAGNTADVRSWERALDESIARAVDELSRAVA
ncbi:MAG: orotidine-5'-phosphate decarboxylase [Deltaproteobacteria bacterium]|nr:orotidine-5'-phosphate decarboxylase [Deltaproteobacteria bacterium]